MSRWQRRARFLIAVFAVVFAILVAFAFRRRAPIDALDAIARTDPKAVVESVAGRVERFKSSHQDVSVEYDRQLTYADGSTKLLGVRVVTEAKDNARTFTVTAKEGQVGQGETDIALTGDVKLMASDGLTAAAEHATYADSDATVRAPGPVSFSRGRLSGAGIGMTYDKTRDALTILKQAAVHMKPDAKGAGGMEVTSERAVVARREKRLQFDGGVHVARGGQDIEADQAIAHLTDDNKRVESVELHGGARIAGSSGGAGALRSIAGHDMNLNYAADGQTLQHAVIVGTGVLQLAGDAGKAGREIAANIIDVGLAADGATPTALAARETVMVTFPAEAGAAERKIGADTLQAQGKTGRGLTRAQFTGNVRYRERGGGADRAVNSGSLDVDLKPGMSAIDDARFARGVRFVDEHITATSALGRYNLGKGTLELTGSEPASPTPHVVDGRIAVDATRVDVALAGPKLKAAGAVKSVLQPVGKGAKSGGSEKMPSMLKPDQPVNVTADDLKYDGAVSMATYTGHAQLWQGDMSIRAGTIVLDDKSGDLSATGSVATQLSLQRTNKTTKKKEASRSLATSTDFKYEESAHRATYTTDAHMSGPQGDLKATRIELYLKPSGDELERAEAYEAVTLLESGRRTTGDRMTYFGADERYLVTGAPVKIVDECGRETVGRTLTFFQSTDTILVDGNKQIRTTTKGGGTCPGS